MTKPDDILGLKRNGAHADKIGGLAQVFLREIHETSDLTAFGAAGLTRKSKGIHKYRTFYARLYNPNREKYICRNHPRQGPGP